MKRFVYSFWIFGIFVFLFTSCANESNNNSNANIDRSLIILLTDVEGNELYNSPDYPTENIKYFHLINEQLQIPDSDTDGPTFYNFNNLLRMKLFLNANPYEEFPITIIQWNETDSDTVKAHFNRGISNEEDYEVCDKVWVNDVMVWDTSTPSSSGREITIVK